jgi:hypothetical protein
VLEVWTTTWSAPREREALMSEAVRLGIKAGSSGPIVEQPTDLTDEERLAFARGHLGDAPSYDLASRELPPHYLVRLDAKIDGDSVPSEADVALLGVAHGLWLMTLSFFPIHAYSITATCEGRLFAVDGEDQRQLSSHFSHQKRGSIGNFYWMTRYGHVARTWGAQCKSIGAVDAICRRDRWHDQLW